MAPSFLPLCLPSESYVGHNISTLYIGASHSAIITPGCLLSNDVSTVAPLCECLQLFICQTNSAARCSINTSLPFIMIVSIVFICVFQIIIDLPKNDKCLDFIPHSVKTFTPQHSAVSAAQRLRDEQKTQLGIECEWFVNFQPFPSRILNIVSVLG